MKYTNSPYHTLLNSLATVSTEILILHRENTLVITEQSEFGQWVSLSSNCRLYLVLSRKKIALWLNLRQSHHVKKMCYKQSDSNVAQYGMYPKRYVYHGDFS